MNEGEGDMAKAKTDPALGARIRILRQSEVTRTLVKEWTASEKAPPGDDEAEGAAAAFGYRARTLAALPLQRGKSGEYIRDQGDVSMSALAPSEPGLPFGIMPRLLLIWLAAEVARTGSRIIDLGESLFAFMEQVGVSPPGDPAYEPLREDGSPSAGFMAAFMGEPPPPPPSAPPFGHPEDEPSLFEQAQRLFACSFSASWRPRGGRSSAGHHLGDVAHYGVNQSRGTWRAGVRLSEGFYNEAAHHPVPVDLSSIAALANSALALDILLWASHRASRLRAPTTIPWACLALQFGAGHKRPRDFKAAFLAELARVLTVYRRLRCEATRTGLLMRPTLTTINSPSRGLAIDPPGDDDGKKEG